MIKKGFIAVVAAFMVMLAAFMLWAGTSVKVQKLDITVVNDVVKQAAARWEDLVRGEGVPEINDAGAYPFTIFDRNGKILDTTDSGLSSSLSEAVINGDAIADIEKDGVLLGKAVFHNTTPELLQKRSQQYLLCGVILLGGILLCIVCYYWYLQKELLVPFQRMERFARNIARGDFNVPLEMDHTNVFGAFTESFDLMREELKKARENERLANQSKKELVASLSHDIKTPVASIQAISELMLAFPRSSKERNQLETIGQKAEQINQLVTNLFQATMEDLEKLKVETSELESRILCTYVAASDYSHLANLRTVPDCMIIADPLRMQQVIDNVIHNSYKYANTAIDISAACEGDFLAVCFRDFGKGADSEELPLLFEKFYRGRNAKNRNGAGLGLYLSRYFMEQMGGRISCENCEDGFQVTLYIRLA